MDYEAFLDRKAHLAGGDGFDPPWIPDFLFDFQRALVEWSVRRGRAAIFADCGLGKTPMQLVWAENIVRHTNRPVLILTPLAVSHQVVREAQKFGVACERSADGTHSPGARIVVTNYERLEKFAPEQFAGVVCDESSMLKNFDGARRLAVTAFLRTIRYRLLCTATAAPNDYIELGTSSEALGELGHADMLGRFFKNDNNTSNTRVAWRTQGGAERMKWRFKGHAEEPFWRWVCSWGRALRRPSDLGFDDARFDMPKLVQKEHVVAANTTRAGWLFDMPATNLFEEREERRRTIDERCDKVAELVADSDQALMWCHLNDEGSRLVSTIPGAMQVQGSDAPERKEELLLAFQSGELRYLVTKPRIGCFGLNLQKCAHTTFFPSHSYEQYYQGVRRLWRFGQKRAVRVDIVATDGERGVMANLQRKAAQADRMFTSLVHHMNDALTIARTNARIIPTEAPPWLSPISTSTTDSPSTTETAAR